jgi:hypothetical protein
MPASPYNFTDVSDALTASFAIIALMMEAANTSETSVIFYQTTAQDTAIFTSTATVTLERFRCVTRPN